MKTITFILSLIVGISFSTFAGNLPTIGNVGSSININKGSINNYIIVGGISDGDAGSQSVTVSAVSSNNAIISVTSVAYISGQSAAVVNFIDLDSFGSADISVTGTDLDGSFTKKFTINVGNYYPNGILMKVYDVAFWEKLIPTPSTLYQLSTVISQLVLPSQSSFYQDIPLPSLQGSFNNTDKSKYLTTSYVGYLVPPATGVYTFEMVSPNYGVFLLGNNTQPDDDQNIRIIDINENVNTRIGTATLTGGNMYKFKCVYWTIETANMQLNWSGPGLTGTAPISNLYTKLNKDVNKPTAPINLVVSSTGVNFVKIFWGKSFDNVNGESQNTQLVGYNVYLNGVKIQTTTGTNTIVTSLNANTSYNLLVTAFDLVNNESFPSNKVQVQTYPVDNTPPTPPTSIIANDVFDMSANLSWNGAIDIGSEISGYLLYLDGNLYTKNGTVFNSNINIKVLKPNTVYSVMIKSVDGGGNTSAGSNLFAFTTTSFNSLTLATGVKKATVNLSTTPIAVNAGFGLNMYPDVAQDILLSNLKPNLYKWGALEANKYSFEEKTGAGKVRTYGHFLKNVFERNAYANIAIGVRDDLDWRTDMRTFLRFLEYVNGPATTVGGQIRASEGDIEPYLKKGKGLIIELGVEVWGGFSSAPGTNQHSAQIGRDYVEYGKWCRSVAGMIKSSPYYDPAKIFISYSGKNPTSIDSYGLHEKLLTKANSSIDWISISGYLGGNFNYGVNVSREQSDLNYYREGIKLMNKNIEGMKDHLKSLYDSTGRLFKSHFYESNMTTSDYNGRLGQAVIMTDYMLESCKWGGVMPAIFSFDGGIWRIVEPSEGNRPLPFFETARLINFYAQGNILGSQVESASKLLDESDVPINTLEPVGAHFSNNKGKYTLAFFSRDFNEDYQVQIKLPVGATYSNAKKYVVSGADFNTKMAVVDSSNTSQPITNGMIVTVPKNSMIMYVFNGVDLNQKALPLGYSNYKRATSVVITPKGDKNIVFSSGIAQFEAKFFPEDAINNRVDWKVIKNNVQVNSFHDLKVANKLSGIFNVYGNGECSGNGEVIVVAYSASDTLIKSELPINISNQRDEEGPACPTSISDLSKYQTISLQPNPASGNISIISELHKITSYQISSAIGTILENKDGINSSSQIINVSDFPSGLYFVNIHLANGTVLIKKVIKN